MKGNMNFIKSMRDDRALYKHTLAVAVPMILQALVTNFVSLLDNIMVGQVGTCQMNGVSIANMLFFVFNITIFGGLSGAGIFGTQYYGKGDYNGQRYTVRYRLVLATFVTVVAAVGFSVFGQQLLKLYISKDDSPLLQAETLGYGMDYLKIMLWCLPPFAFGQAYASVSREVGQTKVPMYASIAAIGVNLVLDYGLIFGNLGLPQMGVKGAAIATVIAKTIEALVVIIWTHTHPKEHQFVVGLYKSLRIPRDLFGKITIKGAPLLANEFLWSLGISVIAQSYSVLGLDVVAARNIASTVTNLTNVFYLQFGIAVGIVIGATLGANDLKKAEEDSKKLTAFAVLLSGITVVLLVIASVFFPNLYNTTDEIKALAAYIIILNGLVSPIWAYDNVAYFILRSGGKTGITFLFDFVFAWIIQIPLSFVLTRYTSLDVKLIFFIVIFSEIIKCVAGYIMLRSGIWINNIVDKIDTGE